MAKSTYTTVDGITLRNTGGKCSISNDYNPNPGAGAATWIDVDCNAATDILLGHSPFPTEAGYQQHHETRGDAMAFDTHGLAKKPKATAHNRGFSYDDGTGVAKQSLSRNDVLVIGLPLAGAALLGFLAHKKFPGNMVATLSLAAIGGVVGYGAYSFINKPAPLTGTK